MNFSIILNTRNRISLLNNLFSSIKNNTKDLDKTQILLSIDNDDKDTESFIQSHSLRSSIHYLESIPRERNLHIRLNRLAKKAKGKYIFVLNDDCEIVTPNWDQVSFDILKEQEKIIYGRTHDTSCDKGGDKQYASFPIISKAAVKALGFFMHEEFVGLGGDVGIYRVYNQVNRVVDIPIVIDHKLHKTVAQVCSPDKVALEMRQNTYKVRFDPFNFDISEDVIRLNEKITSSL